MGVSWLLDRTPHRVFDGLSTEVVTTETDDPEQLFAEWNRGSGKESDRFLDLRYCERCQNYTEGSYSRGAERRMSVGDIVDQGDEDYVCAPIGWQEIELLP